MRFQLFLKTVVFEQVGRREAIGPNIARFGRPKGVQHGAQEGAKTGQKREKTNKGS